MTKFRTREVVEAEQWFPGKTIEGLTISDDGIYIGSDGKAWGYINAGDWVVRDPETGAMEIYDRSVFERKYESLAS